MSIPVWNAGQRLPRPRTLDADDRLGTSHLNRVTGPGQPTPAPIGAPGPVIRPARARARRACITGQHTNTSHDEVTSAGTTSSAARSEVGNRDSNRQPPIRDPAWLPPGARPPQHVAVSNREVLHERL